MEHEASIDPDLKRLQDKAKKGASNVVSEVLADPKVQTIIKGALLRETVRQSIIMACIFIGLLKLYDVVKTVTQFDWRGDLLIGAVLVAIGLIYMLKNMYFGKKNGNSASNDSPSSSS